MRALALLGIALAVAGCAGAESVTQPPLLAVPEIMITAVPDSVAFGDDVLLEWTITGPTPAISCRRSWDPRGLPPVGQEVVFPAESADYTIQCPGNAGSGEGSVRVGVGPVPPAGQRATGDRPDEIEGARVHVVYATPLGGTDRNFDTDGTLEHSIATMQAWLERETGGRRFAFDTFGGALDITFQQVDTVNVLLAFNEIVDRFAGAETLTLIVYEGDGDALGLTRCGTGFLQRAILALGEGCPNKLPTVNNKMRPFEVTLLHEMFHSLGTVGPPAPNSCGAQHVCDSNIDLMFNNFLPPAPVLDKNRDDYYNEQGLPPGIRNTAFSPFLRPLLADPGSSP